MKRFWSHYFPILPVAVLLGTLLFSNSCANTTQAPTGGAKDTIAPVILRVTPAPNVRGVPTRGAQFTFTFDEYVKVANPKNIFLSPPTETAPKYKLKGKSLVVSFESDLQENTTYTLSFTDALVDNNESNPFPGFSYVFSTGDEIDSLMITGVVQDCSTLEPVKGATVLLYKDHADSAVFLRRPFAAVKTDAWGFFAIRNIPDTLYRLYAITDDNNNNIYDPDTELVGFVDSLIRPVTVVRDSLLELAGLDVTDTVSCRARKTEYEINLFRETPSRQYLRNSGRTSERAGFISFNARGAHIDTMWVRGLPADRLITQMNLQRDSLEIWINDQRAIPDTLHLFTNYLKTDSLGQLSSFTEETRLVNPNPRRVRRGERVQIEHNDTICGLKLAVAPETVEQSGFTLTFDYPVVRADFDSVRMWAVNPRQQEEPVTYHVTQDSLNLRVYTLSPGVTLQRGYEYFVKVPERAFQDINGYFNDSTEVSVTLPSDPTLSTLELVVNGVYSHYLIELLSEKMDVVYRQFYVHEDQTLTFPYLKASKYCIRITEDSNQNSFVDSGSVLENQPPERVKFFKFNDQTVFDIPEGAEVTQKVDLTELF